MKSAALLLCIVSTSALALSNPGAPAKPASGGSSSLVYKGKDACSNCGTVESVNTVTKKGEGSGLGAVAGGVIGGVLGHQVGGGRGKDVATVAGAAGGAYAGHQVEKNMKKKTEYHVSVKMDDGSLRKMTYAQQPGYRVGDRVKFSEGKMARM